MQKEVERLLEKHQLRKTAMRRQVLELFLGSGTKALASSDIEKELSSADRITLYRTLKSFEQKGLIHQAVDGSGVNKYAICDASCTVHEHHDEHAHFHCTNCGKTICLDGNIKPQVAIPVGYVVDQSHLVLEGRCDQCAVRASI